MAKTLDLYFDFISPFSYFVHLKLPDLARKYGYRIAYHPIDIPTAKLAAGNYGPSNQKVPAKIRALMQDLHRWAEHYGVPFNFPSGMGGRRINTGAFFAIDNGKAEAYVDAGYRRLWGDGGVDAADEGFLRQLAADVGLDADAYMQYVDSPEGARAFEQSRNEAHSRGVFGSPIMMVDDQIWWGNDRLMFIEQYLQAHPGS